MAVMHQPVRACVLTEQDRDIDGGPQTEKLAPGAVDQLMRCRMTDLAQPEPHGKEGQHPFARPKPAVACDGPDRDRQHGQGTQAHADQKDVGGRKLGPVRRPCGQGDDLVQKHGQHRHVEERRPEPGPAKGQPKGQQGQGQK